MKDFEIIEWPDIQAFMEIDGFKENSALIEPNENIGIGSSTYLVSIKWYEEINSIKIVDKISSLYGTVWHNSKEELPDEKRIVISYSENKKKAHIGFRSNIQGYYRWAYLEDIDPQI